jgi:hypothetical protein
VPIFRIGQCRDCTGNAVCREWVQGPAQGTEQGGIDARFLANGSQQGANARRFRQSKTSQPGEVELTVPDQVNHAGNGFHRSRVRDFVDVSKRIESRSLFIVDAFLFRTGAGSRSARESRELLLILTGLLDALVSVLLA